MSKTPRTMTIFFIQEQSSIGAWESMGVGYKDEDQADAHVRRLTAKQLVERLDDDQFATLFSAFERPEGAEFAGLTDSEAKIALLLKVENETQGFLNHGVEEVYGECGGWFSYEDCEITL
jgi:hypothetical protein